MEIPPMFMPYFEPPRVEIGPFTVHAFGILVAVGILVGVEVTLRRVRFEGLDRSVANRVIRYALLWGFVAAHVLDLVFYSPELVLRNPWSLLWLWDGISSFGGMLGGLAGMVLFLGLRRPDLTVTERWRHVDAVAYGWPFAWVFGRLACTVATDHPGAVTDGFALATRLDSSAARRFIREIYENAGRAHELPGDAALSSMGFHNLGFYELLYTVGVIAPLFLVLGRRRRPAGYFLAVFAAVYAPARFVLDIPRMTDATYFGLTPAQYASLATALAAWAFLARHWAKGAAVAKPAAGHRAAPCPLAEPVPDSPSRPPL